MAFIVAVAPMRKLYAISCEQNKRKFFKSLVRVFTVHINQAFKCGVVLVMLGLGFYLLSRFNLSNEEEDGAENTGINTCSMCKCPAPGHVFTFLLAETVWILQWPSGILQFSSS